MTMPAGTYYVGDLCYVMHPEWNEFCDLTINDDGINEGQFALSDGRWFAFNNTKWGDGVYNDEQGRSYSVDAGLIGCIKIEDIDESEQKNIRDGHVIIFDAPFEVFSDNGIIYFGTEIAIDTDPKEEYDDDYDDEEDM